MNCETGVYAGQENCRDVSQVLDAEPSVLLAEGRVGQVPRSRTAGQRYFGKVAKSGEPRPRVVDGPQKEFGSVQVTSFILL